MFSFFSCRGDRDSFLQKPFGWLFFRRCTVGPFPNIIRPFVFSPFLLVGLSRRCSQLFLVVFDFFRVSTLFPVSGQIEERSFPCEVRRGPWTATWRCSWTKDQSIARSCDSRGYRIHQSWLKRSCDERNPKIVIF